MTEIEIRKGDLVTNNEKFDHLKKITWAVYILYACSLIAGITLIIGVIIAYLKRNEAKGTIFESHLQWLITTFWWGLALSIISIITFFIIIGWFIAVGTGVWFIYRIVKGWLKLMEGKEVN